MSAKDTEIWAVSGMLEEKERAYAEIAERLEDTDALSNRAMKKLREKQKIIQEQAKLLKEKETESKDNAGGGENLKEKERAYAEMTKRLEEAEAAMKKLSDKEK